MNTKQLKEEIKTGSFDKLLSEIYFENKEDRKERLISAVDTYVKIYGESDDVMIFSVPGRSEISGNHTDHNHGRVVAGSVDCDIIAVAGKNNSNTVNVKSEGYRKDVVDIEKLEKGEHPNFTSASLICGTCAFFKEKGYNIGGFNAYTTSNVLKGSGLSSSAAFEVMIGNILNHLFNEGKIGNDKLAIIAQMAENQYFGKPCGLMDQMACALGGFITIDFIDPKNPDYTAKSFDLNKFGYDLCIVNAGGSHASLNDEYASIPGEMKAVARLFGSEVLRGVSVLELLKNADIIREKTSDRAFLRALHFVNEDIRAAEVGRAMDNNDIDGFLNKIEESGLSSVKNLQNIYAPSDPANQSISVALSVTEEILKKIPKRSVCRVHGGGFAGTIQVFVPKEYTELYKTEIDGVLGEGSCMVFHVRPYGAIRIA